MRFENTVEFDFGKDTQISSMLAMHGWSKSLGVVNGQVLGIMPIILAPTNLVRVKFKSNILYEEFLSKY